MKAFRCARCGEFKDGEPTRLKFPYSILIGGDLQTTFELCSDCKTDMSNLVKGDMDIWYAKTNIKPNKSELR